MSKLEELMKLNHVTNLKTDKERIAELESIIEEQNDALMELAELISEVIDNG